MKLVHAANALLLAGLVGLSYYVFPELPERIPQHFGMDGAPDRWSERTLLSWMLLPLMGAATATMLYAVGLYLPRHPESLNMPDRKKLLELPRELQSYVLEAAVNMVHVTTLGLLVMFCSMQYGAWESARTGARSSALVAGVILGVAVMPFLAIGCIVAIQRRMDRAWREYQGMSTDLSR